MMLQTKQFELVQGFPRKEQPNLVAWKRRCWFPGFLPCPFKGTSPMDWQYFKCLWSKLSSWTYQMLLILGGLPPSFHLLWNCCSSSWNLAWSTWAPKTCFGLCATLQAFPQYSFGWPFQVGLPQPGAMQVGPADTPSAAGSGVAPPESTGPAGRTSVEAGPAALQALLQYSLGLRFQVGLPQPAKQTGAAEGAVATPVGTARWKVPPAAPVTLHFRLQYWFGIPFQVGFPQPGVEQSAPAAVAVPAPPTAATDAAAAAMLAPPGAAFLHALPQKAPGWPFHVGLPHPGARHTAAAAAAGPTAPTGSAVAAGADDTAGAKLAAAPAALQALPQYSCGLPFHVGLPQPGCMQTGGGAAPPAPAAALLRHALPQ
mmetsp:Transcript_7485/g.23799  ORF Transcript_7485/g.23799 Transcript_7485/m.23799 type:complete len:371 (-) Transcript_7485:62-1174(-)